MISKIKIYDDKGRVTEVSFSLDGKFKVKRLAENMRLIEIDHIINYVKLSNEIYNEVPNEQ